MKYVKPIFVAAGVFFLLFSLSWLFMREDSQGHYVDIRIPPMKSSRLVSLESVMAKEGLNEAQLNEYDRLHARWTRSWKIEVPVMLSDIVKFEEIGGNKKLVRYLSERGWLQYQIDEFVRTVDEAIPGYLR